MSLRTPRPCVGRCYRCDSVCSRLDRSIETLLLGEFRCEPDRRWVLDPGSPPLLQLGPSPYLQQQLETLACRLVEFQGRLLDDMKGPACARRLSEHDERLPARGLRGPPRFWQRFLPVCIAIHATSSMRCAVCIFEICAFHEKQPEQPLLPLLHEAIAENFQRLFEYLERNLIALTAPRRHRRG